MVGSSIFPPAYRRRNPLIFIPQPRCSLSVAELIAVTVLPQSPPLISPWLVPGNLQALSNLMVPPFQLFRPVRLNLSPGRGIRIKFRAWSYMLQTFRQIQQPPLHPQAYPRYGIRFSRHNPPPLSCLQYRVPKSSRNQNAVKPQHFRSFFSRSRHKSLISTISWWIAAWWRASAAEINIR